MEEEGQVKAYVHGVREQMEQDCKWKKKEWEYKTSRENERMREWENERMREWENERMRRETVSICTIQRRRYVDIFHWSLVTVSQTHKLDSHSLGVFCVLCFVFDIDS